MGFVVNSKKGGKLMNILIDTKYNKADYSQKQKNVDKACNIVKTIPDKLENTGLEVLGNYNLPLLFKGDVDNVPQSTKLLNVDRLKSLGIPNFRLIDNNCVRGETLSSRKNKKFLIPVSKNGIKNIIDLRDKFSSQSFEQMCRQNHLNYYHIPIDSSSVNNRKLINSLPKLFNVLEQGNAYVACAQGLHRTDIALAINYLFNPRKQETPPIMYGHFRENSFKFEDIARRVNLIKKELQPEDIKMLKWPSMDAFNDEFATRKKLLIEYNCNLIEKYSK